MDEICHVIGIDVSKLKLDIALLRSGKIKSKVFDNKAQGYVLLNQYGYRQGVIAVQTHVCMEATGPYSEAIALALQGSAKTSKVSYRLANSLPGW